MEYKDYKSERKLFFQRRKIVFKKDISSAIVQNCNINFQILFRSTGVRLRRRILTSGHYVSLTVSTLLKIT